MPVALTQLTQVICEFETYAGVVLSFKKTCGTFSRDDSEGIYFISLALDHDSIPLHILLRKSSGYDEGLQVWACIIKLDLHIPIMLCLSVRPEILSVACGVIRAA